MKKLLLCSFLLTLSIVETFAQLNEGFENGFPPENWTIFPDPATANTASPRMERVTYASVSDFKNYILGYKHGADYVLQSVGGGFGSVSTSMVAKPTDNWLISPQLTVGENDFLNFMLGANCAHNNTATAGKFQFEVVISLSGKEFTDFTDTIFHITPKSILTWSSYTLDLSKYKGKQIYIAFHDYGTYTTTSFVTNKTYLDDIKIIQGNRSDLSLISIDSPVLGCNVEQPVILNVKNTGAPVSSFDVSYQVGNGAIVKETFNRPIAQNEIQLITLTQPATLVAGSVNAFKAWISNASVVDANLDNDTITASIKIGSDLSYPYLGTAETLQTDFAPSSNYSGGGWAWYATDAAWKYTKIRTAKNILLQSNCILFPKSTVRVIFEYKSTVPFQLEARLGEFVLANYQSAGTSDSFISSANEWKKVGFNFEVAETGLYSIGFIPKITDLNGEVLIRNIKICDPYDDVVAQRVASPVTSAKLLNTNLTVAALFKNAGAKELTNILVYYQVGNQEPKSGLIPTLSVGQEVTYAFTDKTLLNVAGEQTLKIWSALSSDGDLTNDTIVSSLYVYEAKSFPYTTGFEEEADYYSWSPVNVDLDNVYWGVISSSATSPTIDGNHSAYINSFSGVTHNDWMISPAISMPKGKARISFYYTTFYSSGVTNLKVYMGTGENPADMTELLVTEIVDNPLSPRMGSAYVDISTAGNYYFGFYDEGLGRDILLDNVHIDAAEDLMAVSTGFDVVTDFDLTSAQVNFTIKNCGMSDRTNIPVSYQVNGGASVNEIIAAPIKPGESLPYTFKTPVDISANTSYVVVSTVSDAADVDPFNNRQTSASISNYATKSIPCTQNFADAQEINYWTLNGNWQAGTNMTNANAAYDGTGGMRHLYAAQVTGGDWAYSAPMNIPAGTYELSYFFRTMLNNAGDAYKCSFKIYLGTARNPEAMTLLVDEHTDVTVITKQYEKVIKSIQIDQADKYYIGICYTGTSTSGVLFMDCFTIADPVHTGLSLPYTADFAQAEDEWYHYNPAPSHFEQWTKTTLGEETYMKTQLSSVAVYASKTLPGVYRSPAFSLHKGDLVTATYDYSIINSVVTDTEEQYLSLYLADVDKPDAFTQLVAQGNDNTGDRAVASGTVTIPADGIYYFGYQIATPVATQAFNLYSTRIVQSGTALESTSDNNWSLKLSQNILYVTGTYQTLRLYNVNGSPLGVYSDQSAIDLNRFPSGVYLVRIEGDGKLLTDKIIVK